LEWALPSEPSEFQAENIANAESTLSAPTETTLPQCNNLAADLA
jgi:hypothetical protein